MFRGEGKSSEVNEDLKGENKTVRLRKVNKQLRNSFMKVERWNNLDYVDLFMTLKAEDERKHLQLQPKSFSYLDARTSKDQLSKVPSMCTPSNEKCTLKIHSLEM